MLFVISKGDVRISTKEDFKKKEKMMKLKKMRILARRDANTFITTAVIAISMICLVYLCPHPLCEKVVSTLEGFTMITIIIVTLVTVSYYHWRIAKKKLVELDQQIL